MAYFIVDINSTDDKVPFIKIPNNREFIGRGWKSSLLLHLQSQTHHFSFEKNRELIVPYVIVSPKIIK